MGMEATGAAKGSVNHGGDRLYRHDPPRRPNTGTDEELLWNLLHNLEPEDGLIWVYDIDGETPALTEFGIETLRELIREFVDKRAG
jgi:hypothetical protein